MIDDEIQIIDDHNDWLVIDKPAGINFHSENGQPGIIEIVRHQLATRDLWPVHRLDKPTSGLLLIAKSADSAAKLSALFANHEIQKFYLAVIDQTPKKKQGWVIGDMVKSRRGSFKLLKSKDNPAITQFFSVSIGQKRRLCLLKPQTGKTHQLRVALKSLGAPIVGDHSYAGSNADRVYLHAYALRFMYEGQLFNIQHGPSKGELFQGQAIDAALSDWRTPYALEWPKKAIKVPKST